MRGVDVAGPLTRMRQRHRLLENAWPRARSSAQSAAEYSWVSSGTASAVELRLRQGQPVRLLALAPRSLAIAEEMQPQRFLVEHPTDSSRRDTALLDQLAPGARVRTAAADVAVAKEFAEARCSSMRAHRRRGAASRMRWPVPAAPEPTPRRQSRRS